VKSRSAALFHITWRYCFSRVSPARTEIPMTPEHQAAIPKAADDRHDLATALGIEVPNILDEGD
jgi:hypothetical protein